MFGFLNVPALIVVLILLVVGYSLLFRVFFKTRQSNFQKDKDSSLNHTTRSHYPNQPKTDVTINFDNPGWRAQLRVLEEAGDVEVLPRNGDDYWIKEED